MRLVHSHQRRLAFGQHFGEAWNAEPLRRDEQELQLALQIVDAGLPGCGAVAAGVDALHRKAPLFQLRHLIFHQRDQRADHQRGAAQRDAGQLVTERFPRARWHHQ